MGQRYSQLGLDERVEISRLSRAGCSIRQIAAALGRPPSAVSRELRRNSGVQVGYDPVHADTLKQARRWIGARLDRDGSLRDRVLGLLQAGLSPEQVAGHLAREAGEPVISPESIYRFVHAQIARHKDYSWRHLLPRGKSKRGFRGRKGGSSAKTISGRVSIHARPAEAEMREEPGHWEADLMAFSRYGQNILMLHERSSRLLLAQAIQTKRAAEVAQEIAMMLAPFPPDLRRTLTFDNGTEFAAHRDLRHLQIDTYFCDPYAPWQKGGIENAIGRLRRTLPRKIDLATLTPSDITRRVAHYNNIPRKCIDFRSPAEVIYRALLHFKCESTSPPPRG